MKLKIGNLEYEKGDIIIPGDVMRDMDFERLFDAYKILEEIKEREEIETIYIYVCEKCDNKVIYETINSMPRYCEHCDNTDEVFGESFVGYVVL